MAGRSLAVSSHMTRSGQLLANATSNPIGRPAGLDADKFTTVKNALERGYQGPKRSSLIGISISSVARYRNRITETTA